MASSGGSLNTAAVNNFRYNPTLSSYPTSQYMNNFTDLLTSNNKDYEEKSSSLNWGMDSDNYNNNKNRSFPPLSPPPFSPSFFLDSPSLFGSSNVSPSLPRFQFLCPN